MPTESKTPFVNSSETLSERGSLSFLARLDNISYIQKFVNTPESTV